MDPFVLRMTRLNSDAQWKYWRGEIEKLGNIVAQLAKDFNTIHIETQKIFDQQLEKCLHKTGYGMECIHYLKDMN